MHDAPGLFPAYPERVRESPRAVGRLSSHLITPVIRHPRGNVVRNFVELEIHYCFGRATPKGWSIPSR